MPIQTRLDSLLESPAVEITWLGHACFRFRSRDATIVTDPFSSEGWGYPPLATTADLVTVSHDHPHHAHVDAVAGNPRVIHGPGEYELRGVMLAGVRTRCKAADGQIPQANTVFVLKLEDLTVCHLGDLGQALTAEHLDVMQNCDVLCVPVGGHCTIDATQAAAVIAQIEPRIIIPMHFATPGSEGVPLESADRFCREMAATSASPQARLNVTAASLPSEPTVVLLEQRR